MNTINFNVSLFGAVTQYSSTLSLARVRIFYTGVNRNATYISEEFAEKILSTLSYAPIKGIYDNDNDGKDFTDHGRKRSEGRIYGVVPENPNVSWEDHVDDDGVTRTYACADVLLFTALYPEAAEVTGKAQSMELYAQSIVGNWEIVDAQRVFVYKEGCFLGLQVLGKKIEPCFEGAEFFTLYANLKNLIDNLGGTETMTFNFKLSDKLNFDKFFYAINKRCTEEFDWEIEYAVCDLQTDCALCYDYTTKGFFRQSYQLDDTGTIILGDRANSIMLEITEVEQQALSTLKAANNNNFIDVDKVYAAASNKITELEGNLRDDQVAYDNVVLHCAQQKEEIVNLTTQYSTATNELTTLQGLHQQKVDELTNLTTECNQLKEFKLEREKQDRTAVINKYATVLDEDAIKGIANIDNYTATDLEKELAYMACQHNPNIFMSKGTNDDNYIPDLKNGVIKSDVTQLLIKNKTKK